MSLASEKVTFLGVTFDPVLTSLSPSVSVTLSGSVRSTILSDEFSVGPLTRDEANTNPPKLSALVEVFEVDERVGGREGERGGGGRGGGGE